MSRRSPLGRRADGFSMIEILVTLVIVAFALLGLAGFVTRATAASGEAAQRARAAAVLNDMASRLANNKANAISYASPTVVHGASSLNCSALTVQAQIDLCQWNNLLVGTSDALTAGTASALTFRGCIVRPNASDPVYVVTVAWGATVPGIPPADTCAAETFGDESFRRILRTQVRIATLAA